MKQKFPTAKTSVLTPPLRFSPYAWAKLLHLRDLGPTEVGGFGVTPADDLLFVEDFVLVAQTCSPVTVELWDDAVADLFEQQVELGHTPKQFARLWIHTHPGQSPLPSAIDETTFERVFGGSDFALMFILARGGQSYARLQFNVGPRGAIELAVEVDFSQTFQAADHAAWNEEYLRCVQPLMPVKRDAVLEQLAAPEDETLAWRRAWHAYTDDEFWEEMLNYDRY